MKYWTMTLHSNHYRLLIFLFLFLWLSNLQTKGQIQEACLSGDCKKGFGMQYSKTSIMNYRVGNFDRKGELNGEGIEFRWDYNAKQRETEFLSKWKTKIPALSDIQEFRPSEMRIGNFKDGLLEGNGTMVQTNPEFPNPHLSWLTKADFNPFANKTIKYLKYEGNFIGSQIQKKGIVTLIFWPTTRGSTESPDTLICVSDNLFQEKEKKNVVSEIISAEMVIETKSKSAPRSIFHEPVSLLKGTFVNRKLDGWAIRYKPYFKNPAISKFHRELWFYGEKIYSDNGGAYPFDSENAQTIKIGSNIEITGPLVNGAVTGFGTIVNKSESLSYTGNIINNKADGYGLRIKNGIQYGLFKSDSLVSGTQEYSNWYGFRITRGMFDGFKEGNVSITTYPTFTDFIEGKPFKEKYEGYIKEGIGAHGYGKEWSGTTVKEGQFENGRFVGGASKLYNITADMVLSKDGMASFVTKINYYGSIIELADGRTIRKTDLSSWKESRHPYQSFFKNCTCGGDGTSWKNVSVSGSSNSWTRTEQVNSSAVTGYWQGTQQVTTTTATPGYNYDVKTSCSNTNAKWIRVGFSGLAHVIPASVSLKE
jgi:hypothetical protein